MSIWICMLSAIIFPNCYHGLIQSDACNGFTEYHSQVDWTIHSSQLQNVPINSNTFNIFNSIWQMSLYSIRSINCQEIGETYSIKLCLIWMPLEWTKIYTFYSVKFPFIDSIWQKGHSFATETNELCAQFSEYNINNDYSFSSVDISLISFTITLSLNLVEIHTNNIAWEYYSSFTWDEYAEKSHSDLILSHECSIDITNWNDYPLIPEYSQQRNFHINASTIRESWNTGEEITLSSKQTSMWQTRIYLNNENRLFYMEICMTQIPTDWSEIKLFYTMKYCQLLWIYVNNITLQMNDDNLCFGQSLDEYWLELIDLLLFDKLKLDLFISIIQIRNNDGHIVYKEALAFQEYETHQINMYQDVDRMCFNEVKDAIILIYVKYPELRKYEDKTTLCHILLSFVNGSYIQEPSHHNSCAIITSPDGVSNNEELNTKLFYTIERNYYRYENVTIQVIERQSYSKTFEIKGSKWELHAYANEYGAVYFIQICINEMPLRWGEIRAYCIISLCQFGLRFIDETIFNKRNTTACFNRFVSDDFSKVFEIMQLNNVKLSLSIKITRIIDEYGFTIYKNNITLQQYETLEMTKSNEWNKYCFQSSRYYLSPDYVLLDINEVSTSQLLYDSRSFCEHIAESIEQISFSILIVLLIDIIKPYWIQQIVKMKKRKSSECAWVRCNRTKAEFKLYWCKRCHGQSTYYCGSNHQKKHWKYVHFMHCGYMRICW
eukprot:20804_1